jgi:hypothetical protein
VIKWKNDKLKEFISTVDYLLNKAQRKIDSARPEDYNENEYVQLLNIREKLKEIKKDIMVFAKKNPKLFLNLANDENIQLRNFAIKATEAGIIKLSQDQRDFKWATNGKKLMTVPFDENPYSAMAAYFKTDEGVEIYKSIEKKLE